MYYQGDGGILESMGRHSADPDLQRISTMYILLYCIENDPVECFWREFDTFKSIDAANLIMRAGQREYPLRTWKIVTPVSVQG
jgi:hypothetical protein